MSKGRFAPVFLNLPPRRRPGVVRGRQCWSAAKGTRAPEFRRVRLHPRRTVKAQVGGEGDRSGTRGGQFRDSREHFGLNRDTAVGARPRSPSPAMGSAQSGEAGRRPAADGSPGDRVAAGCGGRPEQRRGRQARPVPVFAARLGRARGHAWADVQVVGKKGPGRGRGAEAGGVHRVAARGGRAPGTAAGRPAVAVGSGCCGRSAPKGTPARRTGAPGRRGPHRAGAVAARKGAGRTFPVFSLRRAPDRSAARTRRWAAKGTRRAGRAAAGVSPMCPPGVPALPPIRPRPGFACSSPITPDLRGARA